MTQENFGHDEFGAQDFGEQNDVVRFLVSRAGEKAKIVTTHISIVVLGADRVYKLKRAVRFPYLDFSTPPKRLAMCEREFALNQSFAPKLYLGAHRVTREAAGALAIDGAGEVVDAVVVMRRFDDDALFDALARRGRLTASRVEQLALRVAQIHDAAAPDLERGGADAMRRVLRGNASSLRASSLFPHEESDALIAALEAALADAAPRLDARRAQGKVRRCHGDLTLRNICLYEDAPTPFDCLEFDDDIATIDVLYDLAFLLMDLLRVDHADFASVAFNRYLDRRDETDGLVLLPFFMALRATIRAHVEAAQQHLDIAQNYFALAPRLLSPAKPVLVAIGGFSGSGKSSVAAMLAPELAAPGARILNSDRLRKQLYGVAPTERLPQEAYAPDVSERVYAGLFERAGETAKAGWPVVVDAVFDRPEDRARIESVAREAGAPFRGFWLDVSFAERAARVDKRVGDVSDATRAVLEQQMRKNTGEMSWTRIEARSGVESVAKAIMAASRR